MDDIPADLRATFAAREELGPRYEEALVDSFVTKLDHSLDAKIAAAVASGQPQRRARFSGSAVTSVALGVPISAIVTTQLHGGWGFLGLLVSWVGIAAVNGMQAIRH